MTILIGADRSPRHGQYTIDGQKYPRVSTILGVISKPGLEAWRLKIGVEEAHRLSQAAADFGTAFHAAAEDLDRNGSVALDRAGRDLMPLLMVYARWRNETRAVPVAIEETVHHAAWGYAGTLDRVYRLPDGSLVLADFKTGKSVDGITRLQLTAYAEAWEAMGREPIAGRMVLHLPRDRPGDLKAIAYDDDERDRRAWRRCLGLWRWWSRHARDWEATR